MFVMKLSPLKGARFLLGVDPKKDPDTPEVHTMKRQIQSACKTQEIPHEVANVGTTRARYKVTKADLKVWYSTKWKRREPVSPCSSWRTQEALNGRR